MKLWLKFICSGAAGLALLASASAQVLRVDVLSPVNESNLAFQPGTRQATGTAALSGGAITGLTLNTVGAGYTTAPAVTFSGGGGSGAAATVTLTPGPVPTTVATIILSSGGSGYTTAPTVTISGGGGAGATASATGISALGVGTVTINDPGAGYTSAPAVTFSGGGGTGAAATAVLSADLVGAVNVTASGSGFLFAPTVTIAAPPGVVVINARVSGTASTYHTVFYVNGLPVSYSIDGTSTPATSWTPPQPGAYYITAKTTDDFGNSATSLPVRVFIVGTTILSPVQNTLVPLGSSVVIAAEATPAGGFIKQIEFFVNGASIGVDTTAPYSIAYQPPAAGTYTLTAVAVDNNGAVLPTSPPVPITAVTPIGSAPTIKIVNPIAGSSVSAGTNVNIIADAADADGYIQKVEFYLNGTLINTDQAFPYTATWNPVTAGRYYLVAMAFDDKANAVASAPTLITVTAGFPTISITSPVSGAAPFPQGKKVAVSVNAAGADGGISSLAKIEFLVDGNLNDSLPKNPNNLAIPPPIAEPFTFTWKSNIALGTHRLSARVTDTQGLSITSAEVLVSVIANQLPVVAITNPQPFTPLRVGFSVNLLATATDADGSIDNVEFFVNGVSLGSVTTAPFTLAWTPKTEGPYTLTAKATDDCGAVVTSPSLGVTVNANASAASSNTVFRGNYQGTGESGQFTFVNLGGRSADFIGYASTTPAKIYYYPGIAVDDGGSFSLVDASNRTLISGQISDTGVMGTFNPTGSALVTFIGPAIADNGASKVTAGYYAGSLNGNLGTQVTGIAGPDGLITFFVTDGTFRDAGMSSRTFTSTGGFTATLTAGTRITSGNIDPTTGFLTGTVTGSLNGSLIGAFASGSAVSDGELRGLSTRGSVGTGANILIAGFNIGGVSPKQVIMRALGPSLTAQGVAGALANPQLQVYDVNGVAVPGGYNDNWAASPLVSAALAQANLAAPASALESVLVLTLSPGVYTAQVSGVSGGTGNGLVEIYAADAYTPFSTQKIAAISTRGVVGSGDAVLIAGFTVNGTMSKKVLVQAVGRSSLPTLGTSGLADPVLRLLRLNADGRTWTLVRENDNWETGNDSLLAIDAANRAGATPLVSGSTDSAMLIALPPGTYTAVVSGAGSATGIALVQVYEVP